MPKLTKPRSRFGEAPPAMEDTKGNLTAPETAPATPTAELDNGPSDGRSLRATGRTMQFATRVHPNWKAKLHRIARSTGKLYVEILEEALDDLERKLAK